MMRYPVYPSQRYAGDPFPYDQGPPDALPSGENPAASTYPMTKGRFLAGIGATGADPSRPPSADPGLKDYPNELDTLAAADDVQGNGIFDAFNTHGNVHPDAGVFADRESLPGYLARERFFTPSEVLDVTTGEPVVYVPGNFFMLDPRTDKTLADLSLYIPGLPGNARPARTQSTVIPNEGAWAVGADAATPPPPTYQPASSTKMFVVAGIAGLAIGLVAGMMSK